MTKYFLVVIASAGLVFGLCCKDNCIAPIEDAFSWHISPSAL
jgi:hypothetical protein